MNINCLKFLLSLLLLVNIAPVQAAYVIKSGNITHVDRYSSRSSEDLTGEFESAISNKELDKASTAFTLLFHNHRDKAIALLNYQSSAYFFLGVNYYLANDHDTALQYLDKYFQESDKESLEYFKEGMEYRFAVAEYFRKGQKRRPMGKAFLPKMLGATTQAIEIYDQIIASLRHDELAAKALFSRGLTLKGLKMHMDSIESFKTLIHSFSQTPLALLAYQEVGSVYLDMSKQNAQNPYLLDLAKLNIRKFQQHYPNDQEHLTMLEKMLGSMEENFSSKLKDIAELYERKKMPEAAVVYYHNAVANYPDTKSAGFCKQRLKKLADIYQRLGLSHDVLQN